MFLIYRTKDKPLSYLLLLIQILFRVQSSRVEAALVRVDLERSSDAFGRGGVDNHARVGQTDHSLLELRRGRVFAELLLKMLLNGLQRRTEISSKRVK